ncbi:MAG: hypothetical protein LAO20_06650 [Acidobacteriia bacterium]|nr:hypothetical protein [Terriglobia bacterium]
MEPDNQDEQPAGRESSAPGRAPGLAGTRITGLIHTLNHDRHLGRALDSLRVCDEVIVVDHGSTDDTVSVAHEYGARVLRGSADVPRGTYAQRASHAWVLCLLPEESLAETLEASLLEWRLAAREDGVTAFNAALREQQGGGWRLLPVATRLVNCRQRAWNGEMPPTDVEAETLEGHILRFQDGR